MAENKPQKPLESLSARALGAYVYLKVTGAPVTADSLSQVFKEGRGAFLTALRELRDLGIVVTKRQLINGKYVTHSYLDEKWESENGSPIFGLLLQQNKYKAISNINYITDSCSSKQLYSFKNMPADAGGEFYKVLNIPVGGDMDNDYYEDQMRERERWKRESAAENEEKKRKSFQKDVASKNKIPLAQRNVSGSITEFIERVEGMWNVKPWTQDKTNFRIAFAKARQTHGTNGEIEARMMDAFFEPMSHISEVSDPNLLWRKFISMFGSLSIQVKSTMISGDKVEKEDARVAKSMEKLFDV